MEKLVMFIWLIVGLGCAAWTIASLESVGRKGSLWNFVGFGLGMIVFQSPLLVWGFLIDQADPKLETRTESIYDRI